MTDIRGHIRAIACRDLLAERMLGRADIVEWAPALISAQDDPTSERPWASGLGTRFPDAQELAEALIPRVEMPAMETGGLPVPGGVRHPLLQWSPVLQFARLRAGDGRVGGRLIEELPRSFSMLAAWLERSMGLMPDAETQGHGFNSQFIAECFRKRFTFSVDEIAHWLIGLRRSDPVLYVLLLSREYRLALRHRPALGDAPAAGSAAAMAMPALKLPPILAAMTIGEIQRMAALTHDLAQRTGETVSKIGEEVGDHDTPIAIRGFRMAEAIRSRDGAGFVYDHAPMRAEAIRKRVFLLCHRDFSKLDKDSFLRAILGGRTDWNHVRSAGRHGGARELIASVLAPRMFKKRVGGRGLRHHNDPLDIYYGVPTGRLPYVALIELGVLFRNVNDRDNTSPIADCIRAVSAGSGFETGGSQERKHRTAVKELELCLRRYPRLGSGGRFLAVAWLEPERDAALFEQLLQPVRAIDPRRLRSGTRWMYPVALRYLQLSFPRLYDHVRSHAQSARIMAHLATSAAAVTSDPIFFSLLNDALARQPGVGRESSNFVRRRPPSTVLPIAQGIIDRVRFEGGNGERVV